MSNAASLEAEQQYTEFIKMARAQRTWDWAPERGILGLTEYFFFPKKIQEYRFRNEKQKA